MPACGRNLGSAQRHCQSMRSPLSARAPKKMKLYASSFNPREGTDYCYVSLQGRHRHPVALTEWRNAFCCNPGFPATAEVFNLSCRCLECSGSYSAIDECYGRALIISVSEVGYPSPA
ncbi:hypothetical protein XAUC_29700 [Xanthomonas citri pv. aurantifolii str. ICPB 10535]|nr:hypothetical protein XAUC_29700 [Xanthomonas citri pv. aurantifolii str. ICPB 10535]